jgi:tetratricopeptide (TPR) repeat protein
MAQGEFEEAVHLGRSRIANLDTNPDSWRDRSRLAEGIATALYRDGDCCAAAIEYERAVQMHRSHSPVPTCHLPRCLLYWGRMLLWTGRPAEAEEKFAEALMLLDHLPVDSQEGRPFVLVDLAQLYGFEKEYSTAETILKEAIGLMAQFGYRNQHLAFAYFQLAQVYQAQGRWEAAERTMSKAVEWLRNGNNNPRGFAEVLSIYGMQLFRCGQMTKARECQQEALAILQNIRKPGHFLLEQVKSRLARIEAV